MVHNFQIIIMNNFNDSLFTHANREETLETAFVRARTQQTTFFRTLDGKCALLEQSVKYLQKTLSHLEQKLKQHAVGSSMDRMAQLRDKQKQFIILQLQKKVKRIEASEQSAHALLTQKQSSLYDLQYKCEDLRLENAELKQQLAKKTKQIKDLIKTNSTLKVTKTLSVEKPLPALNLSELGTKKEQFQIESQNYEEIESKLKEMEDCLNEQIEQYKRKNTKLEEQIANLKKQVKKQSENARKVYELQMKMKTMANENKQLEEMYTTQLALNNENELKFHKKINDLKIQIQECKKIYKNYGKDAEKELRKLSAAVLGSNDKSTIFIGASTLSQQFSELTKQVLKCHKKQLNALTLQKDTVIQELKVNLESFKSKMRELNTTVEKLKASKASEKQDKSPVINGHSISNKSNSKTDLEVRQKENSEKLEKTEQRYEQKIAEMKAALEEKERQVNSMRKRHDENETELSRKVLELEAKVAEVEMELKYQMQKVAQSVKNASQTQKSLKADCERQLGLAKQKIKDCEAQKDEIRAKVRQNQQKLYAKEKSIRQLEKKNKEAAQKLKKVQKKLQQKQQEHKMAIESKEKTIEGLIQKNQNLVMQAKLLKQKCKLIQMNLKNQKEQNQSSTQQAQQNQINASNVKQLQNQFTIEKELLSSQITKLEGKINELKEQIEEKDQQIRAKEDKINQISAERIKNQNQIKVLRNQNEILKQSSEKLKETGEKTNNFGQLRQQYEKREKMLKSQGQKIISDLKNAKKELQSENKKLSEQKSTLKQEIGKLKHSLTVFEEEKSKFDLEKFKDSERQRKVMKDYESKINALSSKVQELQKAQLPAQKASIQDKKPKKQLKGTDSLEYTEFGIGTEPVSTTSTAINTVDMFALQTQNKGQANRFLDFNYDEPNFMDSSANKKEEAMKNSNLFMNLNDNPAADDVFEICDEDEEVNFGQSSLNLQIRELFTGLRLEIEKLFNEEQISFGITKILPQALQDDYYEMMGYIKQKIAEIKVNNEISFIMAEPGNEPEPALDQSLHLPELINRHNSEGQSLRKIVQQQEAMIHSLMNERTEQQNTINQLTLEKEQIEQENENKFMNQCNLYKKQIKEHKKNIDVLEMNFQSMKNIIRNVLEAFSEDEDMEDDFRDSMTMYAKVGKLSEKERSRINYYIQRYLEIKGLNGGD